MSDTVTITDDMLRDVRQWALNKIHAGQEPPWSWYQHMKLVEAIEAIVENRMEVSLKIIKEPKNEHS